MGTGIADRVIATPPQSTPTPEVNFYLGDIGFVARMRRLLGKHYAFAEPLLVRGGHAAANEIDALAAIADANTPTLQRYDRMGERIDRLDYHPAYERMRELAYGQGLIALAYNDRALPCGGRAPRVLTLGLGYVFSQAEQGLFCPVCMTDGAADLIERFGDSNLQNQFLPHLTSTDTASLWEGAMWLTEVQGGSDVGANTTLAHQDDDGVWRLTGEKWFCSNLGAETMLVLARIDGAVAGTRGLGLFVVPLHLTDGSRNAIVFERVKDKLGTRSMPTGEAQLNGALGYQLAGAGQGFKAMTYMLNMSRLYNAVASCAIMRRSTFEAITHAQTREAFGKQLSDHPLHRRVLTTMLVQTEAATALVFDAVRLADAVRSSEADADATCMHRILTPLIKLHTGKRAIAIASESVEALGGNGYVEEFVTARLLRDAQVLPIWEGTTNILALDLFTRALPKHEGLKALDRFIDKHLALTPASLQSEAACVRKAWRALAQTLTTAFENTHARARELAFELARICEAALLLDEARFGAREHLIASEHARLCGFSSDQPDAVNDGDWQLLVHGS